MCHAPSSVLPMQATGMMCLLQSWARATQKRWKVATAQSLSKLIQEFIQFQDDHLGRSAKNPTLTRLPVRLFYDLSSGGSLCQILLAMYKFKNDMEWSRFDLSSPYRKNTNLLMCKTVEDHLIRKKCFYVPVIYIKDNVSAEDKEKIKEIIKSQCKFFS